MERTQLCLVHFFTKAFLFFCSILGAQDDTYSIPKATELVIPASPAYQMLDANSSLVNSPGAIRDFKVDWSFRTYRLAPNLAIEAQPVWTLFYNRPDLGRYQRASPLMKMLSTLSVSIGSLDATDTTRLFAAAGKLTLFRSYDPLVSKESFEDIILEYEAQRQELDAQYYALKQEHKQETSPKMKDSLLIALSQIADAIDQLKQSQKSRIRERQDELKTRHWNSSAIDVAFGRSALFNRSISERIDSIQFRPQAFSVWVNAALAIKRKFMLTSLLRTEQSRISLPDSGKIQVNTVSLDPFTGDTLFIDTHDSLFVNFTEARKTIVSLGINLRYGSPRFSFFVEGFFTQNRMPTFREQRWAAVSGSGPGYGNDPVSAGTGPRVKRSVLMNEFILAFGGEWRISSSVMLSYGIRNVFNEKWKFINILPLASITCLMR